MAGPDHRAHETDPPRLPLLRRQSARHVEGLQGAAAGASGSSRQGGAHVPHRVRPARCEAGRGEEDRRAAAGHDEPADARPVQHRAQDRSDRHGARSPGTGLRDRRGPAAEGDLHQAGRALGREGARVLGPYGVFEPGRPHEVRADAGGHQGPGAAGAAAESGFRVLLPGVGRSTRTGPAARPEGRARRTRTVTRLRDLG